ncbi:RagB/SusD family nutrient uptake outer membrane protein [Pedobacter yulinensis]|uniref:RagB/SusD family nutrient uptake outer membrane protein n=1 Tax=Pedobacter yulinensis TaxID=2126353 RepID=A0A2T3HNA6_9SPHI|nr:RagB/SusD family nutrient uptake outer membrane protein [Pedobacter yulinensis]PST83924.1 RagB/SusD family nutrient uptake outer membrane protein [Pedobacter yulinensis]
MKKLFYFTCAVICLAFAGCEKFLTHDDPTNISDDIWWNTQTDVNNALNSVYAGIPDGSSGRQLMFLDALSDNAVARQSTRGDYESYVKGLQAPNWGVGTGVWRDDYLDIRRANRFLENVDRAYIQDTQLKNRFVYEARALRAYYHMELAMLFGGVTIMTKSTTPTDSYLPRNSAKEVYDFVVKELTDCASNGHLPDKYIDNVDLKRISAATCWALISRYAMHMKDYELAKTSAKKIIDMNIYSLRRSATPRTSYADLFLYTGEINNERIFFREIGSGGNQWLTFAPLGTGGKTVVSPTASIVNAFETKQGKTLEELGPDSLAIYMRDPNYKNNRDPRMLASIILPGTTYTGVVLSPFAPTGLDKLGDQNSTPTGYWINKYLDPKDKTGTRTLDFMIIRYAEILLNYVECLIEQGDHNNPDVVKYLNEIRSRATMPNVNTAVYNTQEKLRELLRRERRVELAFEGVRYYDIRRWGIFEQVMNGQVLGAVNPATGQPVNVEVRKASANRDILWPIPQAEMLANPNMTQNPNYN